MKKIYIKLSLNSDAHPALIAAIEQTAARRRRERIIGLLYLGLMHEGKGDETAKQAMPRRAQEAQVDSTGDDSETEGLASAFGIT